MAARAADRRASHRARWGLGAAGAVALGFIVATSGARWEPHEQEPGFAMLRGTLDPLREAFERGRGRVRILALLAPACSVCQAGAQAIERDVLAVLPGEEPEILLVWIAALPLDVEGNVPNGLERLARDPRVHRFFDAEQLLGRRLRERLGWRLRGAPWDVYLVYGPDAAWGADGPPVPDRWLHQRGGGDPARLRGAADLGPDLRRAVEELRARRRMDARVRRSPE